MDDMKPKRFPAGALLLILGVIVLIIGIVAWNVMGTEKFVTVVDISESYDASQVSKLNIDLGIGTTKIESCDGTQIRIEGRNIPEEAYIFECSGDTFSLKYKQHKWYEWYKQPFAFYYNDADDEMELTVYIPNKEYDKLTLQGGVGEYTVKGISCKEADCDFGVGEGTMENLTVSGKTDIDTGVGQLKMVNCTLGYVDIDCGVGEIDFSGRINNGLDVDGGVGECTFDIDGYRAQYKIDTDSGVEDVSIKGSDTVPEGISGTIPVKVDCGVGEINFIFN